VNKEDLQKQIELLVKDDERSQQTIINQKQEIERLNNIISELEKESYLGMLENQNNNDYAKGLYTAYKYINDKLHELKGSEKE